MSKILISVYYGFANAGDEAMLTAIIESLRQVEKNVELTVLSGNPEDTAAKHQVCSVYRFNPLGIIRAMKDSELIISGGGSLLQDVTSKRSLLYYLSIIGLGKFFGKKVMLFAQGIGPIRAKWARKLTSLVCNEADLITVRDSESAAELIEMGVKPEKITVTADSVLSLNPVTKECGQNLLQEAGVDLTKPVIGISVRPWSGDSQCFQVLAEAASKLQQSYGAQLILLPLQYSVDVKACEKLRKALVCQKDIFLLNEKYNTEEFLSIIGNFDLLIGMRLHALVFAAVMQTPLLAISYDPKVDSFVNAIGEKPIGTVEKIDRDTIVQAAVAGWQKTPLEQNKNIEILRHKAQINSDKAFALLKKVEEKR